MPSSQRSIEGNLYRAGKHALVYMKLHAWWGLLFCLIAVVASLGTISIAHAVGALITATKTYALINDADGNGFASPGDTLRYSVTISDAGADATDVRLTDIIDGNTSLVSGSTAASPVAVNDTYPQTVIGNVGINSATIPFSVSTNDVLGLNPSATITAFDATTTQGGQISMTTSGAGMGQFTYNPPPGFEGTDSFTYTLSDNPNAGSAATNRTASVSIPVSGMVWFINNTASACTTLTAGCGRLSNPFSTLAAFNALNNGTGNNPAMNDSIFIYESATAYTGPVTLLSGQNLFGQDSNTSLASLASLTPPAGSNGLPAMNTGGNACTISNSGASAINLNGAGTSNKLNGFTVGNSNPGINGTSFGTLSVGDVVVNSNGQALNLSTGTISQTANYNGFSSVTSSGGTNNVSLTGIAGTLALGSGSLSGATDTAFNVSGGTLSTAYSGNVAQPNNAAAVSILNHSSGTLTFSTGTLTATNGTGLQFNNADGTYNFNGTTTLNGGDAGMDITTGSAGTFTFASGTTITNPSGIAFREDTSTATVNYNGTITKTNNANNAVAINAKTGGTTTFAGAISGSTTTANALNLTNNTGSTFTFTGGLTLTTTSATAFNATGGGTLNVCDENPCNPAATGALVNTLTSASGTALNVANTTIGANGLEFKSISASGGMNGIVLNTTGSSGGLKVKGDSGSSNNGSGGTLQNISTSAIQLTNTRNVSLDQMNILNTTQSGRSGINGTAVTNFSFTNGTINNTGSQNADANIAFNTTNFSGVQTQVGNNINGTLTVTGSNLINGYSAGLDVQSDAGTLTIADISNNILTIPTSHTGAISLVGTGNAGTSFSLNNATINQNNITYTGASGIQVSIGNSNASGPGATAGIPGDASNIISITNNSILVAGTGTQAIIMANSGGNPAPRTRTNFLIQCNGKNTGGCSSPTGNALGSSNIGTVILIGNNGFADMTGLVNNNAIVATHTPNGGGGNGIAGGNGTGGIPSTVYTPSATLVITNNTLSGTDGNGILLVGRSGSLSGGQLNLKIANNNVGAPVNTGGSPREGIRIDAGNASSADDAVCLNITGNTTAGSNEAGGIGLRKQGSVAGTNDFGIQGILQALPTNAQVQTYVGGRNASSSGSAFPSVNGVDIISGSNYVQCLVPAIAFEPSNKTQVVAQNLPQTNPLALAQAMNSGMRPANPFIVLPAANNTFKLASLAKPDSLALNVVETSKKPDFEGSSSHVSNLQPAPLKSGETVSFGPLALLPAGKSVTIKFDVTINTPTSPLNLGQVSNQGTVSGSNFSSVLTDDPGVGGATDPTITLLPHPDLTEVVIFNSVSNVVDFKTGWTWDLQITNDGAVGANFASPQVILTDALPDTNLTYGAAIVGSASNITGIGNISCSIASSTLTCSASGPVIIGANGSFHVSFPVTPLAVGFFTNPRSGGFCAVDPDNHIAETSEDNNDCFYDHVSVEKADTFSYIAGSSPNPSVFGVDFVMVNFGVNVQPNGSGTPSGNVIVSDGLGGPGDICEVPVTAFHCLLYPSAPGILTLTVSYPGDTNYNGNTSQGVSHTVIRPDTSISSINRSVPVFTPTNSTSVTWTVTFADPVFGLTASNFSLVNSGLTASSITSVSPVTATPATQWNITVNTGTGDGSLGLNLVNDTGISRHVTTSLPFVGQVYSLDRTAPTTTSFTRQTPVTSPTNADTLVFRLTYNEAVTDVAAADFAVSGTTAAPTGTGFVSSGVYDITIAGGDLAGYNGTVGLNFSPGLSISDLAGNPLANTEPSIDQTYTLDNTPPAVTINQAVSQADPTNAGPINFTAVFSESVGSSFGTGNVTLSGTAGATTATVTEIAPFDGTTYNVASSGMFSNGTVIASILANKAQDLAGNNNTASTSTDNSVTYVPPTDLSITKTDGMTSAVPGGSLTYTVTASNAGPNADPFATVADTFPASLTSTWTCVGAGGGTCTAAGSGNINDTVNLPAGGSVTYTAFATIRASATGSLSNTATISSSISDTNPDNNNATDTDTLTPQADLSITKTDGVTIAVPGSSVTYTITASNSGPSNASGATVADTFPASLTPTWTCVGAGGGTCTASGLGNINDTVHLPAGGSVTYTVSASVSAAATGSLSNTATITAPGGVTDPTPANNSATDTDTITPHTDLSITKTDGVTIAVPGGSLTYTITASNAGPSNAFGATAADIFPASLTSTWTCAGAGGGTCTASGLGNINDTVNLPPGGSVTYTAVATVNLSATGTLLNTATITAPGGVTDPTPGNNSATDSDTTVPPVDVTINQALGQSDPTNASPIDFRVVFASAVTGFGNSDVSLSGTAAASTAFVTGGPTIYNVAVSGMTGDGTVIATIAAAVATGSQGQPNAASSSTDHTITYDNTAPTTTITSTNGLGIPPGPGITTNLDSGTFDFTGNDGSGVGGLTFQCKLDAGAYTACTSPHNFGSLTDGPHTFYVYATDSLGNADASPATHAWTVDTITPTVVSITTTTSNPTNISPIPVTITYSEPVCGFDSTTGVDLNLTNGTTSALTSGSNGSTVYSFNLTPSGQGLVSLYLKSGSVYDGDCVTPLNYNSVDSAPFSLTYDTVAPNTIIDSNPTNPTSSTSAAFTFHGTDLGGSGVASFECDLDGGGFSACTSPKDYTGLADGSHTFQVRAFDNAGNFDLTSAAFTWVVDASAPDTLIDTHPADPTNDTWATFTFHADDGTGVGGLTYQCKLDSEASMSCLSGITYASPAPDGLGQGSHTFLVKASDRLGNTDLSPASYTWMIDTTGPSVVVSSGISSPTHTSPITVTITFSEAVTGFTPSVASGDIVIGGVGGVDSNPQMVSSTVYTFELAPSAQGAVTVAVPGGSAFDAASNANQDSNTFSLTYDTVRPTLTLNQAAGQVDPSGTSPVNFTATFSESVSGLSGTEFDLSASSAPGSLSALVSGEPDVYNLSVTGMTGDGTVIASLPANSAFDAAKNGNDASTSTDNSVSYIFEAAPVIIEGSSLNVTMSKNGSPVPFALTLHATDINFDPLTWSILAPASSGIAGINPGTGAVTYMPNSNFVGADLFIVQVSDGHGATDSISVNLTVQGSSAVGKINSVADSGDGQISEGEHTPAAIKQLLVVFNNSMDPADAQNIANYTLVQGAATPVIINSSLYADASRTATLDINTGTALPEGKYTLTVKGSLHDSINQALGVDFVRTFYIDNTGIQVILNGVTRPDGKVLVSGSTLSTSLAEIWVTFNEQAANPAGDSGSNDVTNPANYLLVRAGPNKTFDTLACKPGLGGDDVAVPTGPVSYTDGGGSGPFISKVRLNKGIALANGNYKLFICGTTSITDLAGNHLNGGSDSTLIFSILKQAAANDDLPSTGFAPNQVTRLPLQPAEKAYTAQDDLWLEIPRLGVRMTIVGVPDSDGSWDVSWLGNQAGWLNGTAFPTSAGNSVLTGHVYLANGQPGPFVSLNTLWWGDKVIVHAGTLRYTYEVRAVEQVAPDSVSTAIKHETLPWLTLMTCRGYDEASNSYKYRILVRAVLVSAK